MLAGTSRRRFLQLLGLSTLAGVEGCTEWRGPLRIGANAWTGFAALRWAEQSGALRGVRVLDMPNSSAVLAAFRNGLLEAAALSVDEMLQLVAAGMAVRVVLVFSVSDGGDAIVAVPRLTSPYTLAGARIAVETEALGAYMLSRVLDLTGLSADSIKVVALSADEHERAFEAGEVDAVVTYEPMRSRLLQGGARELFNSHQIPGEIVHVLVARADLPAAGQSALQRAVRAYFAALPALRNIPEQLAQLLGPRLGLDGMQLRQALPGVGLQSLAGNRSMLGEARWLGQLRQFSQSLQRRSLLPLGSLVLDELLEPHYVRSLTP